MARTLPRTAQKSSGQLITGALWNAGPYALTNFATAPPIFRSRQGTALAMASGNWYLMGLNSTDVDSDGGHSDVTNNSRYTCQVAGWYYVEGYFAVQNGGSPGRFECSIAKNGTIIGGSAQFLNRQNDLQSLMAGTLVQLSTGDYVETYGRQNTGGTLNTFVGTDLDSCMNIFWVHS